VGEDAVDEAGTGGRTASRAGSGALTGALTPTGTVAASALRLPSTPTGANACATGTGVPVADTAERGPKHSTTQHTHHHQGDHRATKVSARPHEWFNGSNPPQLRLDPTRPAAVHSSAPDGSGGKRQGEHLHTVSYGPPDH